jgi:hypothetical protein
MAIFINRYGETQHSLLRAQSQARQQVGSPMLQSAEKKP